MNDGMLQQILDRLAVTSLQRWMFIVIAALSCALATSVASVAGAEPVGMTAVVVVGLALAAAARPDSHTALVTEVVIVWQWLAFVDDTLTPWAIVVAGCLVVFHCVISLMAVSPISAVIDGDTLRLWSCRAASVIGASVAMWCVVAAFGERIAAGNVALTVAAFVVLAALVLAARHLSRPVDRPSDLDALS